MVFEVYHESVIDAAPEVVFPAAADPLQQLVWDTRGMRTVENLSDGPLGPGSRYRGRWRKFGTIDYFFNDYDPPRRFSHDATLGLGRVVHTFDLEDIGDGRTLLRQRGVGYPRRRFRPAQALLKALFRQRLAQIAEEIAAHMEEAVPERG